MQMVNQVSSARYFFYIALLAAAVFSIESWILGPLSWIYGYGSGLETIPVLKALSLHKQNFSFWSPFVAGGVDRLSFWGNANPVGPEFLLFSVLPTWLANGLHRFLQYFVAVYFAARVAHEQIGLESRWSMLAGVLFGCFSYFTVGALFTLPGVPLMLWLLWRSVGQRGSILRAIGSALLLSFMTTFTFGVPYLLTFALLWLVLIQRPGWRLAWLHFVIFSVVLMLVTSPQLFAIALNTATSHRANWNLEHISWTLDGLFYRQLQFDLFAQDKSLMTLTMCLPWLAFLVGAVLAFTLWNKEEKQFAHVFVRVVGIFALLSQKWLWLTIQQIVVQFAPFVRGVYMGRFFEIPAAFLIAMGLALTLRMLWAWLSTMRFGRMAQITATGLLVIFMIFKPKLHLFYSLGVDDWGEANYKVQALDSLRLKQHTSPFRVVSVLPLQPAYAYAQGLETVDGWANIYSAAYRDLWLRILSPLFQEIPATQQIFGLNSGRAEDNFIFLGADLVRPGVGLLPNENIKEALKTGFDIDRRFNLNLLRLLNTRYLLSEYPLQSSQIRLVHAPSHWPTWPQYRSRNTGLVEGERQPYAGKESWIRRTFMEAFHAGQRKKQGKDIFIYEIINSLDRFRLVQSIIIEPNAEAVLNRLANSDSLTLNSTASIEKIDAKNILIKKGLAPGTVDLDDYQADSIRMTITSAGVGFLVIANTWNPFWAAFIDGKKSPLLRVNHTQIGLQTPMGTHKVVLQYLPPYNIWS